MQELIEAIRVAVADGATADQKARGAQACRTILTALDTEPGKPLSVGTAPAPHPLANIDPGQALDLLIAKLTAALPAQDKASSTAAPAASNPGLRIAFVPPPPRNLRGPRSARPGRPAGPRKP
jgi:hypothetical protein